MAGRDTYLVIGGSGFVGRHIVLQLQERGDSVSVFDIVQRYHDAPFYSGDICEQDQVANAVRKSGATCIIHTASPPHGMNDPALYFKINVDGTKAVIAAAVECGVKKLVYTSSAGVVFNGTDLNGVDERIPYPEKAMDAYNESKCKGEEAVLAANGKGGLYTVALRPAGIFGPGDRQVMTGFHQVYENGQTHFQLGDNNNLFDWTYVGNVAKAHLLAADRLLDPPPAPPLVSSEDEKVPLDPPGLTEAEQAMINYPLPPISLTTGAMNRIPTSAARPLGPYVERPPNGDALEAAFRAPYDARESNRPVMRTRFDQLSDYNLSRQKLAHPTQPSPLAVAGQVFFITNGEPTYFWDFGRMIWRELDKIFPGKRDPAKVGKYFRLTKDLAMIAAAGAEWVGYFRGKEATFTRFRVTFSCATRWHDIEKARRVLGYEPEVGVEEGIKRMVEWWKTEFVDSQKAQ
ncbi:hypothetical protein K523DRAFT_311522 [Schizophyllum commune Tattone D]|nr:hypothetical protein K523DRAFT_311522 [Schizophyllum commune Tattone D]